jgi:hypothetical protein
MKGLCQNDRVTQTLEDSRAHDINRMAYRIAAAKDYRTRATPQS